MLKHGSKVTSASYSPDGRRILTASRDTTARVWDAATGEPVTPLLKHRGIVNRAAFRQLPEISLPMFDEFGYPLESSVLVQVKSQGGDDGWKVDGTDGSDDPGCR